ncbi:MAG: hypothetical protein QOH65_2402 [Methylobacteriaceae bacterium]|nr:hypothetical protein [Methylobacteriaceae bacterium]
MSLTPLLGAPAIVQWHIAGALIALGLGTAVLFMRKGTRIHRRIGWLWVGAMFAVAITSFWITGIRPGQFSPIHLLSILTLLTLPFAIWARRAGRIGSHRAAMISLYVSLVAAGAFTLIPNRLIGRMVFGG